MNFPFTAALARGHVQLQQKQDEVSVLGGDGTAVSCKCLAWRTVSRAANLEFKKVEIGFRLVRTISYGGGEGCIRVPRSQRRTGRIGAISKVDEGFREGAETDGAGEETTSDDEKVGKDVKIDLQLPRRRLLVEFTCNVCQTRTQRLVNPDAYKRGTVYVQCGECEAYHKLVDNLGLVVDYDFRKETDPNSS